MSTLSRTAALNTSLPRNNRPLRVISFWGLLSLWRSRRALAGLSQAQLDDIGVSAQKAADEARRPLWDVPSHWLK